MLKELFERRSIRRYTDRPIPEDVLTELLRAAMNAPPPATPRAGAFWSSPTGIPWTTFPLSSPTQA